MRRLLVAATLVACSAALSANLAQAPAPSLERLTTADWREDLRAFATRLVESHVAPFHATPRAQFAREIQALDRDLPSLTTGDIVSRFIHLGALIGDTHSRVAAPQLPVAPIELRWYGSELRITRAASAFQSLLGARVVAIGGVDVGTVRTRMAPLLPIDQNASFVRLFSPFLLRSPLLLQTLKILSDPTHLPLTIEQDGRQSQRDVPTTMTGGQASQATDWVAYTPRTADTLLYGRDRGRNWFTYLDDTGLAYIAFNTYGDDAQMAAFQKDLDAFMAQTKPRRAVVDLRNNGGGDFGLGRWFVARAVMRANQLLAPGRLYVITGPDTFSAAAINALDFRRDANAILVGEPPAERTWAYSDSQCGRLPRSGLLACFSTRLYRLTDQDALEMSMDRAIPLTWDDINAGKDPALAWILTQPEPAPASPIAIR